MCNWVNNKNKNNEEKGKIREEKSHDWDFVFVMVVTRFFKKIEDRKETGKMGECDQQILN